MEVSVIECSDSDEDKDMEDEERDKVPEDLPLQELQESQKEEKMKMTFLEGTI